MITQLEDKKASWIHRHRQLIDLEPFFQRGTVWNTRRQQYFIDSLLRGWGTPKLFLWKLSERSYQCLDGKQRITSLLNFMDDGYPLHSEFSGELGGKKYSDLSVTQQDAIHDYVFAVEIITSSTQEEVVELFKRLQGGSPLNFGEKVYAIPGSMNNFIKTRMVTNAFFTKTVSLANTRYSHYAVCAQLALLSVPTTKVDLKLKNLTKFLGEYSSFNASSPEARKILEVIGLLRKVFPTRKETALKNRASVVSAFYLMSELSARGDVSGKEKRIGAFFRKFSRTLQDELRKPPDQRDAELISYQTAVTQSADKIKYVLQRHDILKKRLAAANQFFQALLYPPSPQEEYRQLYETARIKVGVRSVSTFDKWLIANKGLKPFSCRNARGEETLAGHIRNCLHHARHGKYSARQLRVMSHTLRSI